MNPASNRFSIAEKLVELIDQGFIFSVMGDPGSGKTTLNGFLVRRNLSQGYRCIHVLLDHPPSEFVERVTEQDMDVDEVGDRLTVVDGYTPMSGERSEEAFSVDLSGSLSDISITLSKAFRAEEELVFLSFDSLSTLVDYFDEELVLKFLRQLISRLKSNGTSGLFLLTAGIHGSGFYRTVSSISDGVIALRKEEMDKRTIRELYVTKLTGEEIPTNRFNYSLHEDITFFQPFQPPGYEDSVPMKPIPNSSEVMSTGCRDLDGLLDGGFRFGSYNLLETVDVLPMGALSTVLRALTCNALQNGLPVFLLPPGGMSISSVVEMVRGYCKEDIVARRFRVAYYGDVTEEMLLEKPHIVPLRGSAMREDFELSWMAIEDIAEETGEPPLTVVGIDTIENVYGKGVHLEILADSVRSTRKMGGVRVNVIKPGVTAVQELQGISDMHLKIMEANGGVYLYGVRPRTAIYNLRVDKDEDDACQIKLHRVA